jgi:hypothetical protein
MALTDVITNIKGWNNIRRNIQAFYSLKDGINLGFLIPKEKLHSWIRLSPIAVGSCIHMYLGLNNTRATCYLINSSFDKQQQPKGSLFEKILEVTTLTSQSINYSTIPNNTDSNQITPAQAQQRHAEWNENGHDFWNELSSTNQTPILFSIPIDDFLREDTQDCDHLLISFALKRNDSIITGYNFEKLVEVIISARKGEDNFLFENVTTPYPPYTPSSGEEFYLLDLAGITP